MKSIYIKKKKRLEKLKGRNQMITSFKSKKRDVEQKEESVTIIYGRSLLFSFPRV